MFHSLGIRLGSVGLAMMLLAGCTTDPVTGEDKPSNTAVGAVIGAVGGATLGAATAAASGKDPAKGALIGAAAGAAAGGLYGARLDRQEEALRKELQDTGVSVTRRDKNIVLNMGKSIVFKSGSTTVPTDGQKVLTSVAKVLDRFDQSKVDVLGFSDSSGSATANKRISERRARNVAGYLQSKGVAPNRLSYEGRGEADPIAPNDTAEGRALNRRVEIHIAPIT